ncbi:MAG TPA: hypothetical protein VG034_17905, partial [Acidimicrobiia bacterium]|nr:hypothetical protein [Acidimicrobiia bacterium]
VGLALGFGLGLGAWPAMANDNWNAGWNHSDDHSSAWGLEVAGEDGPAWGLGVTGHGPAWGVHVDEDNEFSLPIVADGDVLGDDGSGWDMGLSAFGIDDASFTGDNPVADAYLGQSGQGLPVSTIGWDNDRQGWLGGLLGDDSWVVGGLF